MPGCVDVPIPDAISSRDQFVGAYTLDAGRDATGDPHLWPIATAFVGAFD